MFHYRLAAINNRSRVLVAAFLAVALHMGFIYLEFEPKPVSVPSVSLPRSVSVFLRQSSITETPEQPVKKTENINPVKEEVPEAEKEPEVPVPVIAPVIQDKPDNFLKAPPILEKKVKKPVDIVEQQSQPVIAEIVPAYQKAEASKDLNSEPGATTKVQEFATQAEPQTAQKDEGVKQPGTLQMAYPRYQLNDPPAYPGLARRRGQEGSVILQVKVNKEGRVDDLKIDVSSNFTLLDRAAVSAVRKWSFEPGRRGKERVPMWVRVPVTFKLKK